MKDAEFSPLLGTLRKIQFLLEGNPAAPIMVATQTAEEFTKQKIPAHCIVKPRPMIGPRVPNYRPLSRYSNTLADWPNDGMKETLSPVWFCVTRGNVDIRIWDYTVRCGAGDTIFIPGRMPRTGRTRPHYEAITQNTTSDILKISVAQLQDNAVSIKQYHSRNIAYSKGEKGESCFIKYHPLCGVLLALADELIASGHSKSTFYAFLASVLLAQQQIKAGKAFSSWSFPAESHQLQHLDIIEQAQKYMQNHMDRRISIEQVSRWVGLSRTVFIRMFREETGQTFHHYLTTLRMERAEKYLLESTLSIDKISSFVGVSSNQLRHLFQQQYQCSPGQFRRRKRKD